MCDVTSGRLDFLCAPFSPSLSRLSLLWSRTQNRTCERLRPLLLDIDEECKMVENVLVRFVSPLTTTFSTILHSSQVLEKVKSNGSDVREHNFAHKEGGDGWPTFEINLPATFFNAWILPLSRRRVRPSLQLDGRN